MRRIHLELLASIGILLGGCEAPDPSTRRPASSPAIAPAVPSALSLEAQAKEYSIASRPGQAHKVLDPLIGDWEVTLSTLSADGVESEPFRGKATLAWTLGRRFVRWDATVQFGDTAGTTTGFLGFNTRTNQYQLMMISDLATGMEIARGSGEIRAVGIVFEIEQVDPATGGRLVARSRLRILAPDHFVLEQLEPAPGGKDKVTRVWHYRRAGAPTR